LYRSKCSNEKIVLWEIAGSPLKRSTFWHLIGTFTQLIAKSFDEKSFLFCDSFIFKLEFLSFYINSCVFAIPIYRKGCSQSLIIINVILKLSKLKDVTTELQNIYNRS